MAWTLPLYSKPTVADAGKTLVADLAAREDRELAIAIANNWRAAHAFPLNTFQMTLRRRAREIDPTATVAQRTKRLRSIIAKLKRLSWLSLAEMQDLGGCRAVLDDVDEVQALADKYLHHSSSRHALVDQDHYINNPKSSGYRGIHLIYAYESDRKESYNGLKIEIQIRTRLQHAWATAVETVDLFTSQALKASSGRPDWQRFFALMGSALAMREETPLVPRTPTDWPALIQELKRLSRRLKVVERLQGYSRAIEVIQERAHSARFVILELDTARRVLRVHGYDNPLVAVDAYSAFERAAASNSGLDVVLVRTESLSALRTAYPNYFADTDVFVDALLDALSRGG